MRMTWKEAFFEAVNLFLFLIKILPQVIIYSLAAIVYIIACVGIVYLCVEYNWFLGILMFLFLSFLVVLFVFEIVNR